MNNLGLPRGTVKLVPHDENWHERYLEEAKLLQGTLGVNSLAIQHVGSTAIPGILAKPIIDIAIVVDSIDIANEWATPLAEIGYWDKGPQLDMPDRRFFAKGPDDKRTVYLHLVNKQEFERLITFRDALIKNKDLAAQYSALKEQLATSHADDRAVYSRSKNDFIQNVLNRYTIRSLGYTHRDRWWPVR